MMKSHGSVPFKMGDVKATVFGGRYRDFDKSERRLMGVKMAAEINLPYHVSIPTEDFCVPNERDMQSGLIKAFELMEKGNDLYVGCWGGIGRTGLFMGCLAKLLNDCADAGFDDCAVGDPVKWVRENYIPNAIETEEQQAFVRGFDTAPVISMIKVRNLSRMVPVEVEVEKKVLVFPPFWEYMVWWMSGGFMR